jgi:membrane protein required for beta-lactamase induction
LNSLEQRRIQARSALPACHNEAGTPSQASIRDVEQTFSKEKVEIAVRYLAEFQPRLEQLLAAVSPRIAHGDTTLRAWNELGNPFRKAELAPIARGAENDALRDVALIQSYIQDISKLAARSISERNALQRVYANAKGC